MDFFLKEERMKVVSERFFGYATKVQKRGSTWNDEPNRGCSTEVYQRVEVRRIHYIF